MRLVSVSALPRLCWWLAASGAPPTGGRGICSGSRWARAASTEPALAATLGSDFAGGSGALPPLLLVAEGSVMASDGCSPLATSLSPSAR